MTEGVQLLGEAVAVGRVTPRSVRLWMRLENLRPVRVTLVGRRGESEEVHRIAFDVDPHAIAGEAGTFAFTYPDECAGGDPLWSSTWYRFQVTAGERPLAEGRFRTPPSPLDPVPERWTLGIVSCHQPFNARGEITAKARAMLRAANLTVDDVAPDLLLFLGDQVYADADTPYALFREKDENGAPSILALPAEDIRARYHQLYARYWQDPDWRRLHASAATACLPDDHEVVDNWGSAEVHQQQDWLRLGAAALDVAYAWQGLRGAPKSDVYKPFCQQFAWANAAIFMMDARSQRRNTGAPDTSRVVGADQLAEFENFLQAHSDKDVLFVAVTVPLVHMPDWVTALGHKLVGGARDLEDRWSNPLWLDQRDQILRRLERQRIEYRQRIVLLSGDIHVGWVTRLEMPESRDRGDQDAPPMVQFVSSAITNGEGSILGVLSEAMLEAAKFIKSKSAGVNARDIPGIDKARDNPYGGLNIGLVDVCRTSHGTKLRFRLVSHGDEGDDGEGQPPARVVYDSGLT